MLPRSGPWRAALVTLAARAFARLVINPATLSLAARAERRQASRRPLPPGVGRSTVVSLLAD